MAKNKKLKKTEKRRMAMMKHNEVIFNTLGQQVLGLQNLNWGATPPPHFHG